MPRKKGGGGGRGGSAASKMDAYFEAVMNQKLPTVRWSLSNIGSLEASSRTPEGYTAFHVAAASGKAKALEMILSFYARKRALREKGWIELPDADGRTPLMLASARGALDCVEVLLEVEDKHFKGGGEALLKHADPSGRTARDYAVRKQKMNVVEAIDYFLAPPEEEEDDGEEKIGADGLTATERRAQKKANFKLSEREQAAADKKAAEAAAAEKRAAEAGSKPQARWDEVKLIEASYDASARTVCELLINKTDDLSRAEFEELGLAVHPVDPALWFLHSLNRLEIRLPKGVLVDIPGAGLTKLEGLQQLILSHNSLATLPEEIGTLKKLKTLQCDGNCIAELPASLSKCKKLEAVDLSGNCLTSIAVLAPLQKLKTLNVSSNNLPSLDLNWANLTKLTTLYARGNAELAALPFGIGECTLLKSLSLGNTSVAALPSSLSGLKKLKEFDLENVALSNPKVQKKVAGAMDAGKGLKELLKVLAKSGEPDDGTSAAAMAAAEAAAEEGGASAGGKKEKKDKKKKKKKKKDKDKEKE